MSRSYPFVPGGEVPGFPDGPLFSVQKSALMPHWPQILQQTFNGQGFRSVRFWPDDGATDPGFVGPQTAFDTGAGIGGLPLERHMLTPTMMLPHPVHPQVPLVPLLNVSISLTLRPQVAASLEQLSPATTRCVAQVLNIYVSILTTITTDFLCKMQQRAKEPPS